MEYQVVKQHWGDKQYHEGDTREVKVKGDADQLIAMGLIADDKADEAKAQAAAEKAKQEADAEKAKAKAKEEKEAPKPKNKMAKEPENKAE